MAGENEIALPCSADAGKPGDGDGARRAARRWAAGAWKFSPPVAKQFPWKRSYGHGFRRINTARVGNNVRALVQQFARREMCFPNENGEKTAFVDLPQKGHPTQVAFTSINAEFWLAKPSLTI